jgi:hypothetical protein
MYGKLLGINPKELRRFLTYDSPINCSTGMTSNITIEDIVHSYITSCGDHYVLVKDSDDNNYCGMYKYVF